MYLRARFSSPVLDLLSATAGGLIVRLFDAWLSAPLILDDFMEGSCHGQRKRVCQVNLKGLREGDFGSDQSVAIGESLLARESTSGFCPRIVEGELRYNMAALTAPLSCPGRSSVTLQECWQHIRADLEVSSVGMLIRMFKHVKTLHQLKP